jgi:hypothetical protein
VAQFLELNNDQRREVVNTRQRYLSMQDALARAGAYRGSMIWSTTKGHEYLIRVGYDRKGVRRQSSLGPRSGETERIKSEFERGREESRAKLDALRPALKRQAAINRALGLGRVPLLSARIIRALDSSGLLGAGLRVVGTNALYAYEAVAGVFVDPSLTATEDVDLLFDSRMRLSFILSEDVEQASLLRLLRKVDKSFERSRQTFRAANRDGFLVDLIKPMRNPPWKRDPEAVGSDPEDLAAVEIAKLDWHESAPAFEAVSIDERGEPLRIVTTDPRVFAIHKLWLSTRPDREAVKAGRDLLQAHAIAALTRDYFQHLPFEPDELRMLPLDLLQKAAPMFQPDPSGADDP